LLEHANAHLKGVILAALETGMRKGELLSLQWKQVRWIQNEIYLPGAKTKTKRGRRIPISPTLREILTRRQYGATKARIRSTSSSARSTTCLATRPVSGSSMSRRPWENVVLKAHGTKPERTATASLTRACQAAIKQIDLKFHDLRHEAGSRKLEAGWPLHAVSAFLGHGDVTTTARYLNVKDDYLQELIERKPLALVRG